MILDWLQSLMKPAVKTLKANQLLEFKRRHPEAIFLDIREEMEAREEGIFPGATRSAWKSEGFDLTLRRFPKERPIVVLCQSGKRSQMAAEKMTQVGFTRVFTLEGGLNAWNATKRKSQPVAV
jgi:rhodanese-related sulfurtransferase